MDDQTRHDECKRVVGAFETLDDRELAVGATVDEQGAG